MKKLTKIPLTPRPPPCAPPTAEYIEKVRQMVPNNVIEHVSQHVAQSNAATLDYSVPYTREYISALLEVMTAWISQDANVITVQAPETSETLETGPCEGYLEMPYLAVIGDLHGTFASLQRALKLDAYQYVFTGDYVDRGGFSVEVLVTLLTLKLLDYDKYVLLRGNHETEAIAQSYSFYAELFCKYSNPSPLFTQFVALFRALPICCRIGRVLALHGGISRHSLQQLTCLNRFREPLSGSALANVLWGDPIEKGGFAPNMSRGIGLFFGPSAVQQFCSENDVDLLVRSHTCVDGVELIGRTLTVFSVPQYLEGNLGAFLYIVRAGGREVVRWSKFTAAAAESIDGVFFQRELDLEKCNGKYLVAAILCGLVEIDYALPETQMTSLVSSDDTIIALPPLSEARLGRLIMDLEELCEVKEIPPLAAVGSLEHQFIAQTVLVGDQTLAERGIQVAENTFRPVFNADELQQIVDRISKGKKVSKKAK